MLVRRVLSAAVAAVLTFVVVACDAGSPAARDTTDTTDPADPTLDDQRYGQAPRRHPDVTFQPDVVIVGGGSRSVRSVSADGLTWRIDPDVDHADEVAQGKVMFLTGRAVGRVLKSERDGADLAVTLGPVDITEVIRDGTFAVDEPVSLESATSYTADQPFWAETDVSGSSAAPAAASRGEGAFVPAGLHAGPPTSLHAEPALAPTTPARVPTPTLSATPICCSGGVGVRFTYDTGGIRFAGSVTLMMTKPSAAFHLEIHGSKVTTAELRVSGAAGLRVEIAAATQVSTVRNINKRLFVPVDFAVPIGQILGVPFAVTVNQMVAVQTAFSSKDGNIKATGEWTLNRSLGFGYANGKFGVQAPDNLAVRHSLTDSITGVSVGVTGIIVTYQAAFRVGLGAFGFTAGLYVKLTASAGMTVGSAAGSPLALCRSAQVGLWASYGVGYTLPPEITKVINAFLNLVNAKPISQEGGIGEVKNVFNKSVIAPDVPLCRS